MKYKALKQQFCQTLEHLYDEQESSGLFFIALQSIEGSTRMLFLEKQQEELQPHVAEALLSLLEELRTSKPIQYILQEAWFYKLRFKVNPSVLIPRDETEELVDLVIRTEQGMEPPARTLLDIGTGSGCIAIAIKKNLAFLDVTALDISSQALEVAATNAKENAVAIRFMVADILQQQPGEVFDIIVSNPPYVKEDERSDMHPNVLAHEPHTALFVRNDDPLIFYRAILAYARKGLVDGGRLYFEINEFLGPEMVALAAEYGFREIKLIKDFQEKDRMLTCRR